MYCILLSPDSYVPEKSSFGFMPRYQHYPEGSNTGYIHVRCPRPSCGMRGYQFIFLVYLTNPLKSFSTLHENFVNNACLLTEPFHHHIEVLLAMPVFQKVIPTIAGNHLFYKIMNGNRNFRVGLLSRYCYIPILLKVLFR